MPRTTAEVYIGPGTLYTAAVGTAYPTNPDTAPSGSWTEIGYSEEGWLVAFDRTIERVFAAEEINALVTLKTGQETHVRGTVMQASLENLVLSFGGGTITPNSPAAGYRTYAPPATTSQTEFAVLFRVPIGTELRDWRFPRALSVGSVEVPHNKSPNVSVIAMDFEVVVPTAGSLFTIIESTA